MRMQFVCTLTLLLGAQCGSLFATSFGQLNLVSDVPGMAYITDPNLKNPWGMSFSATSPFWVSNQASNTATLYNGAGVPQSLIVSVAGGPTGQVFNSAGAGNFTVNGTAANFIFDTLAGTINAWNSSAGTTAMQEAATAGASYTGLALANNGVGNFLYAANFTAGGGINVFNSSFAPTTLGAFTDPSLPAGYAPYNIQLLNGNLYVEYAQVGAGVNNPVRGAGLGIVDVFDTNGNFMQRLISNVPTSHLNVPWGIVLAPAGFGSFGNDLLVGNFGDGTINAFDPNTGVYLGTMTDQNGNPIVINDLWALDFRTNGGSGSNPNALYFDAGINREVDGLFGELAPFPEPSTWALAALGTIGLAALSIKRRRSRV